MLDTSSNICVCNTGSYLPAGGTVCLPCSAQFSMCLACTAITCSSCQSPATVSGLGCICPSGYYNNTLSCELCSAQFLGCNQCLLGTCSACDTSLYFIAAPSSNVCSCQSGYVMVGSTCTSCASLINGCTDCSSPSICTTCDAAANFYPDSGHCLCSPTFFLNSSNQCQTCVSSIIGCSTCSDGVTCDTCLTANHFMLTSDSTCECMPTYVLSGTDCVSCMVSCVCYGYQLNSAGVCTSFCSDSITVYPHEECDDGNLIDGDGCSSQCTAEANYSCVVDAHLQSSCSYNQPLNISLLSTIKSPDSNQLTFNLQLGPALPDLANMNFS